MYRTFLPSANALLETVRFHAWEKFSGAGFILFHAQLYTYTE